MPTRLGEKLRKHRENKGYSLDKLAELAKTSKSYLWELENRDERKPSGEKLTTIALHLGVTTDYLLDDKAEADEGMLQDAFYRKFNHLTPEAKEMVQDIIDKWFKK